MLSGWISLLPCLFLSDFRTQSYRKQICEPGGDATYSSNAVQDITKRNKYSEENNKMDTLQMVLQLLTDDAPPLPVKLTSLDIENSIVQRICDRARAGVVGRKMYVLTLEPDTVDRENERSCSNPKRFYQSPFFRISENIGQGDPCLLGMNLLGG